MLGAFDAKEPNNTDSNRVSYGNNRYLYSNAKQWLNSDASEGAWYESQHEFDQSPESTTYVSQAPYSQMAGFLNTFSQDFKNALLATTIKVAKPTVDGGSYETLEEEKIFLASSAEVGLGNENGIAEGSQLALFTDNNSRISYLTQEAIDNYKERGGTNSYTTETARYWWLRTPYSSVSCYVRYVNSSGALDNNFAFSGHYGLRPLCNLPSSIKVSDVTEIDDFGNEVYVIEFEEETLDKPTISVPNEIYIEPTYHDGNYTGGTAKITWTNVANATTYLLERAVNKGAFVQVYSGPQLEYIDKITGGENGTVDMGILQYRIRAYNGSVYSEYDTSEEREVIDNFAPYISGDNSSFGIRTKPFSYSFRVFDGDDATIECNIYMDDVNSTPIQSFIAEQGKTYTINISGELWAKLKNNSTHSIIIKVKDDQQIESSQTKAFTKQIDGIYIIYKPCEDTANKRPTNIYVALTSVIPAGAELNIKATNNFNDIQPYWEDITHAVKTGHTHKFANPAREASLWGVRVKIELKIGNAIIMPAITQIECRLEYKEK